MRSLWRRTGSGHGAPTSCHRSDRRQLNLYIWRPKGRHVRVSLVKFFQRQRNEVTVTVRAGKVKRVSLEMSLRKSPQNCAGKLKQVC